MLFFVFLAYSLLEWFVARQKPGREKWTVFALIVVMSIWGAFAIWMNGWPTPNQLIRFAFGWLDQ